MGEHKLKTNKKVDKYLEVCDKLHMEKHVAVIHGQGKCWEKWTLSIHSLGLVENSVNKIWCTAVRLIFKGA